MEGCWRKTKQTMKIKLKITMALAVLGLAWGAQAQPSLTGTNGLIGNAISWFTSINTNYSFADVVIWDGPVYVQQLNVANEAGLSYDLWHSDNTPNYAAGTVFAAIEGRFDQAGIAGAFVSEQGSLEFGYMKGDLRAFGFLGAAYFEEPQVFNTSHRLALSGGVQLEKLWSADGTGAALFVEMQQHQRAPIIGANLTVSFGTIGGFFSKIGL